MQNSKCKKIHMILTNCGPSCGVPEYTKDLSGYLGSVFVTSIEDLKQQKDLEYVIFQCCMDTFEGRLNHPEFIEEIAKICIERDINFSTMIHVVPFFESMEPSIKIFLKKAALFSDWLIVHSELSKVQLNKLGIRNIKIIPHGCHAFKGGEYKSKVYDDNNKPIISSFGGMRHEKGFVNILKAAKKLNLKFRLLSRLNTKSETAMAEYNMLLDEAKGFEDNFEINTENLELKQIFDNLITTDAIIFAYPEKTPFSATSGAIRQALCTGVPVLCTNAPRFSDLEDEVIKIDDSVEGIIKGVEKLVKDEDLRAKLYNATKKFVLDNSWENIAKMYMDAACSTPDIKFDYEV